MIVKEYHDGTKRWFNDQNHLHRLDGPAIEFPDGDKRWYQNDQLHRLDGPAVEESDGTKFWFKDGKKHRIDGPAVEYRDGTKFWYVRGTNITEWIAQQGISDNPTQEEQMYIMMIWG